MTERIFGRNDVRALVKKWLVWPDDGTARPVLVVEGGPGTGRSAVLDALLAELHGRTPTAAFHLGDVERELGSSALAPVLAGAARRLHERIGPFGRIDFPRLTIALKVITLRVDPEDPNAARSVDRALADMRGAQSWSALLQETARGLAEQPALVGDLPVAGALPLLTRLLDATVRRLAGLSRHKRWFGDQDGHWQGDATDALVRLVEDVVLAAGHDRAARERVHDVLWRAFVADIRAGFGRGRAHGRRSAPAVLLLDGADSALGSALLLGPVKRLGLTARDPLTIVAAAGPGLLARIPRAAIHEASPRDRGGDCPWWRTRLRDLTAFEVQDAVEAVAVDLPSDERSTLARELFGVTGGHAGATRALLDAAITPAGSRVELHEALASAYDEHTSVEDHLRGVLLRGVPADFAEGLEVCAAGWNLVDAGSVSTARDLVGHNIDLPPGIWANRGGSPPGLLRRLLLRRLALTNRWAAAYDLLLHRSRRLGDRDATLHYLLATGAVDEVVAELATELDRPGAVDIGRWLTRLHAVAVAPYPDRFTAAPEVTALRLESGAQRGSEPYDAVLAALVRLRLVADPFCGRDRGALHRRVGGALQTLSQYIADPDGVLFREIRSQDALALTWGRSEDLEVVA